MQLPVALHSKSDTKTHRASNPNLNIPNSLIVSRILLIPVLVIHFSTLSNKHTIAAALVFAIAALTDLPDGYLARRNSQVTILGRSPDPVADKLLIVASLTLLVELHRVETWLTPVLFLTYDLQRIGVFMLYLTLALGVISWIRYILKVLEKKSFQKYVRNST